MVKRQIGGTRRVRTRPPRWPRRPSCGSRSGSACTCCPRPRGRRATGRTRGRCWRARSAVVGAVAVPMLIVYALFPATLLRVAFGPDTVVAADALFALGLAMTLLAVAYLTVQYMLALGRVAFLPALARGRAGGDPAARRARDRVAGHVRDDRARRAGHRRALGPGHRPGAQPPPRERSRKSQDQEREAGDRDPVHGDPLVRVVRVVAAAVLGPDQEREDRHGDARGRAAGEREPLGVDARARARRRPAARTAAWRGRRTGSRARARPGRGERGARARAAAAPALQRAR